MSLKPYQERVVEERRELVVKVDKLEQFIKSEVFNSVDSEEQERLRVQFYVMKNYLSILSQRISAFKVE